MPKIAAFNVEFFYIQNNSKCSEVEVGFLKILSVSILTFIRQHENWFPHQHLP